MCILCVCVCVRVCVREDFITPIPCGMWLPFEVSAIVETFIKLVFIAMFRRAGQYIDMLGGYNIYINWFIVFYFPVAGLTMMYILL